MSTGNVDGGNNTGWIFNPGGYTITANNGTYSLTGQSAVIIKTRLITANNGTYALTGQSAALLYGAGYTLTANNGTYALTGQSATIAYAASPFIVIDTHDGDYLKKKFEDEANRARRKKSNIIHAYERLVEGKSEIVEEIVAPFVMQTKRITKVPRIDFDKLLGDFDRIEALWEAYIEMDDMEVVALL